MSLRLHGITIVSMQVHMHLVPLTHELERHFLSDLSVTSENLGVFFLYNTTVRHCRVEIGAMSATSIMFVTVGMFTKVV